MTEQPQEQSAKIAHTTQAELDVNKLERIVADHNKEMRADMASEITGGTRSRAITDVITVKAILDWHNKQTEAEGEELDLDNDGDIAKSLTPIRNGITGEPL